MNLDSIRRNYKKPPIIEALCEIYFSEAQTDPTIPGLFYEQIKHDYPHKKAIPQMNLKMEFSQGNINSLQNQQDIMMRFLNKENSELVQIANNLLTVNRLNPYINYETFIKSIRNALKIYAEVATPKFVHRVGLRYINHIIIPQTVVDLEQYFTYIPKIEEEYYQIQLSLELKPYFEGHSTLIKIASISETNRTEPIKNSKYLLDIYDNIKSVEPFDVEFIIQKINESHENIERVFERAITEQTRELFEGD